VAVITFLALFVLGFAGVTGIAWTAWVMAVLTLAVATGLTFGRRTQTKTA
jgi:hypothetical protein